MKFIILLISIATSTQAIAHSEIIRLKAKQMRWTQSNKLVRQLVICVDAEDNSASSILATVHNSNEVPDIIYLNAGEIKVIGSSTNKKTYVCTQEAFRQVILSGECRYPSTFLGFDTTATADSTFLRLNLPEYIELTYLTLQERAEILSPTICGHIQNSKLDPNSIKYNAE